MIMGSLLVYNYKQRNYFQIAHPNTPKMVVWSFERVMIKYLIFSNIQEYGRNLATLGVEAAKIPEYCSFWQLVAPQDRQAEIRF